MRRRRRGLLKRTSCTCVEVFEARTLLTAIFDPGRSLLEVSLEGADDLKVTASTEGLVLLNGAPVDSGDGALLRAPQLRWLSIRGAAGRNTINVRQVLRTEFPNLQQIAIDGGGASDRIFGSSSGVNVQSRQRDIPNRLVGGGGNDLIHGGGANDVLIGGPGNDRIYGWFGHDFLAGGDGDDYLSGGPQNDRLFGQDGDDDLHGESGTDEIHGQAGNDIGGTGGNFPGDADPVTGFGIEYAYGGSGNDFFFGTAGEQRFFGGPGNDTLGTGDGDDSIYGEAGDDVLPGGRGADFIDGGAGDDLLIGGAGDDVLSAQQGFDILSGGDGSDQLDGGEDEDILIGASTDYDHFPSQWIPIQQVWQNGTHYRSRLTSLIDVNFAAPLRSGDAVRDDDFVDSMTGGAGRDWFLEATRECLGPEHLPAEDRLVDRVRTEGRNLLIPVSAEALKRGPGVMSLVPLEAITRTAVQSGPWSDPAVWDTGSVPGHGSAVRIPANLTVTVDGVFSDRADTVRLEGHLRFAEDRDTQLTVGTLVTLPDSILEIGTPESPIQSDVSATLLIADHGPIDRVADPKALGRGLLAMGRVVMRGTERTAFAALEGNATTGQTELRFVDGIPADWRVGDEIVIAGTSRNSGDEEIRTILDVQNDALIIDPIENWHAVPGTTRPTSTPLRIHVANLTRNVIVRSESTELDRRGHVMFMRHKDVDISYTGFYDLGRTDKKVPINDSLIDENGQLIPGTGTNQRARYSLHFHRSGVVDDGDPAGIHGSVVARSPGWGFVNHSSYVEFTANVSFDVDGAGFASESGDEIGSFRNNIAIRGRGSGLKSVNARHDLQDFGHQGDGFWLQGAGVIVEDNVAAGQKGHGLIVYTRGLVDFDRQDDAAREDAPTLFPTANLEFPEIAGGQEFVPVHDVPVRDFRRNVAYGSATGIAPTYVNFRPREDHDRPRHEVPGLIEDVTSWNNRVGFLGYYLVNSVVRNATVIGRITNPVAYGIKAHVGSENVTFENAHVEGFAWGMTAPRRGDVQILGGYLNNLENILISSIDQSPELDKPVAVQRHHVLVRDTEFGKLPARGLRGRTQKEVILTNWFQVSECTFRHVLLSESVVLDYGEFHNQRVWYALQSPDAVPFPEAHTALDPDWVGLTNEELQRHAGVTFGGAMTPAEAESTDRVFADLGLLFDQATREASRQPARISPADV